MQAVMSVALAKVGLITEQQAVQVKTVPDHLKPYADQIQEIDRLAVLFTQSGVKVSLLDIGTTLAFQAMVGRGEHKEAYEMMLSRMKKIATDHGLA